MRSVIILFFAAFFLVGCAAKKPFKKSYIDEYSLSEEDLSKIQFYTSQDIVLKRRAESGSTGTDKGELVVQSDENIDKVIIKKGTPGVIVKFFDNDQFAIAFEADDDRYLVFGSGASGFYTLQAKEWNAKKEGKITYGEDEYMSASGSGSAYLLFRLRRLKRFEEKQRVAKGRKIK